MRYLMFLQLFAHAHQERWSSLVDAKLRQSLVTRDNYIFNTNYEGTPTAGKVKIPVRDTEVTVKAYDKATGVDLETGSTTYMDLDIDQDMAVNELIDGYDAASVPDNLVADRLDSAAYSLALDMDEKSIRLLEKTSGVNVCATKTAATEETAYKEVLAAKTYLARKGVPTEGRWMICSPEFMATLMMDDHFIRQGDSLCLNPEIRCLKIQRSWLLRKLQRNLSPDIRTGVIVCRSGQCRYMHRIFPVPVSILAHQQYRDVRSSV